MVYPGIGLSEREGKFYCRVRMDWSNASGWRPRVLCFMEIAFGWRSININLRLGAVALDQVGSEHRRGRVRVQQPDLAIAEIVEQPPIPPLTHVPRPNHGRSVDIGIVVDPLKDVGRIDLRLHDYQMPSATFFQHGNNAGLIRVSRLDATPRLEIHFLREGQIQLL